LKIEALILGAHPGVADFHSGSWVEDSRWSTILIKI
jgi:coenzyme F420-reducing hydrogenase beta subunit